MNILGSNTIADVSLKLIGDTWPNGDFSHDLEVQENIKSLAQLIQMLISRLVFISEDVDSCLDNDASNNESVDAVMKCASDCIDDLSDGYHSFKSLYDQRLILSAALVKAYKNLAWKSRRHDDGTLCFGGGWFIVGLSTPEGDYTYHYPNEFWDLFDCQELECGKKWDGHTDKDVNRLLSLNLKGVNS